MIQNREKIVAQDVTGQTWQVLENIKAVLQAAGCTLTDVVKTEVFLSSMALFKDFNLEYAKYFPTQAPARVTIAAELPAKGLVEISAVAFKPFKV